MAEDAWRMYFAEMGGLPASIVFNDGIAKRLNGLPLTHAMKIRIPLKSPRGDGMTTREEAGPVNALDEAFDRIVTAHGGEYLGRVTNNGVRWVLALIPASSEALQAALNTAAAEAGYAVDIHIAPDPEKSVYWQDLYPNEDDRQVMVDMEVQGALQKQGDDPAKAREIGHWIYFRDEAAAEGFAAWARDTGYRIDSVVPSPDAVPLWLVRMTHLGTLQLNDISGHTLTISRRAREDGGQYDGWEAPLTV